MNDDKDLIAEARQEESIQDKLGDGFSEGSEERAFYYEHRDRYKRLADALEARQPTAGDRESIAKQLRDIGAVRKVDQDCSCEDCEATTEWVNAPLGVVLDLVPRAAVPDAATELVDAIRWTVEYVGNDVLPALKGWSWFDALMEHAPEVAQSFVDNPIHFPKPTDAEAERDAALAAIERVREIHVRHKDTHKPDPSVINGNWFCCGAVQLGAVDPYACIACDSPEWPCSTIAALDGAPEPEVKR